MGKTTIEWTEYSWPVLTGCTRVSEGCRNCYSERLTATRLKNIAAYKGLAVMKHGEPRWTGEVRLNETVLDAPLHWKKPRRIFVSQMSDLFHEAVPDEFLDKVFRVMIESRRHTFQCLTKRPERMRDYMTERIKNAHGLAGPWPPRNVWFGVSCEDQPTADERIPILLETPAVIRFISAEPLLQSVDLEHFLPTDEVRDEDAPQLMNFAGGLSWCIVGGESGPGARPCSISWIQSIIAQCVAADVACFVKQLGANAWGRITSASSKDVPLNKDGWLKDRKGGDWDEWSSDLRVREFPHA